MVTVQNEKPVVIECRGFPLFHAMALLAVAHYLTMEVVFRFSMAAIALQAYIAC